LEDEQEAPKKKGEFDVKTFVEFARLGRGIRSIMKGRGQRR